MMYYYAHRAVRSSAEPIEEWLDDVKISIDLLQNLLHKLVLRNFQQNIEHITSSYLYLQPLCLF